METSDVGDVILILTDFGSSEFALLVTCLLTEMLGSTVLNKAGELGDGSNFFGIMMVAHEFEFRTDTIGLFCVVFTTCGVKAQDAVESVGDV
jgi:hypothetical protein